MNHPRLSKSFQFFEFSCGGDETSIGGRQYVVSKVCAVPAVLGRIGEGDEAVPRRRRVGPFEGEGDGKLRKLTYLVSTHIITIKYILYH